MRAELSILPDILLNPSSNFGDVNVHDPCSSSPMPSNPTHSSCGSLVTIDKNLEAAPRNSGANSGQGVPYFMCSPDGSSTKSEVASPAPAVASSPRSIPCQPQNLRSQAGSSQGAGSSVPNSSSPRSDSARVATHDNPSGGKAPTAPPVMPFETDPLTGSGAVASGSDVDDAAVAPPAVSSSPP